ncbi:P-loop containing nucleoside triphosphate hydrolase protein [Suillus subaureus]|uniref:P-loop containing nucleoside triphosphate hydrolase protein n=1 Tax=Suillus subaureus TaxID=48587 RepID=A0A9P7JAY1_9AGAM|nr:P-loop containing nucleoside triphosphate hydrolase protein [Suillus subaureus]KAG1812481.1 P-loop containing nucleoside triphosphate hydrolase protein [Suillus subaureus]
MCRPEATEVTKCIATQIAIINSGEIEVAASTTQSPPKRTSGETELTDSTIQSSTKWNSVETKIADSTIQSSTKWNSVENEIIDSTIQSPPKRNSGEIEIAGSTIQSPPKRHKTIVVFGATGAGKSSLINLMAGKEVATTSPDTKRCTMQWKDYNIGFGGDSYVVFDTIGLEEPQLGIREYLGSIENAYRLIKELDKQGGIDLLLFCIRADRVTATIQSNYRLFHESICEKKIPIALAITHLEREQRMEDWWGRNQATLQNHRIQVAGHACITAANRLDGRHQILYEESRITIRNLVQKSTADGQKQTWTGGNNLFVSLMRKLKESLTASSFVRKKDLVSRLTKRCGMSRDVAKQLARMIKQDVVEASSS